MSKNQSIEQYLEEYRKADGEWFKVKSIVNDSDFLEGVNQLRKRFPQIDERAAFDYELELKRRLLLALERNLKQ